MIILLAAAATAAAALPPRPMRSFGDWTVGCDNGRNCQAVALQPEPGADDDPPHWTLSALRGGTAVAQPEISVEAMFGESKLKSRLVADGKSTPFRFGEDGALLGGGDPVQLLRTLASARSLTFVDAAGKTIGRLSPRGAAAALRWMDEQQLRAGMSSAIVAVGKRTGQLAPPPLPRIPLPPPSAKPPRRLSGSEVATIRQRYECDRPPDDPIGVFRLDAGNSLAIVPCMLHAYQSSSVVVVARDIGQWRPAPLERKFASEAPDETPEWMTEPEYDPADRILRTSYKGRGLGDCGGTESYVWDGRRFKLAFLAAMDRCGGSRVRITLWRTANQPDP